MIRKLQIKFVAMCMVLVTAVLGVVFAAVFFSLRVFTLPSPFGVIDSFIVFSIPGWI